MQRADVGDVEKITLFTYDDNARISILRQLRTMNDKKTSLLVNKNDFKVFMTKDGVTPEIESFLEHLRLTSLEAHGKMLQRAVSFFRQ